MILIAQHFKIPLVMFSSTLIVENKKPVMVVYSQSHVSHYYVKTPGVVIDTPLKYKGINSVGLKRRGFSSEDRKLIKKIYQIYFRSGKNRDEAIKIIQSEFPKTEIVSKVISFINQSNRGII